MSVLTCPRCRSEVHVSEGSAPVCPACGLGARDAVEPSVRGAGPEPLAGPVPRVASASGRWKVPVLVAALLVLAAVAAAVVFVGGDSGARALSQEDAEEVAGLAMTRLMEDVQAEDGGELKRFSGTFSFRGEFASGTADFELEWGRDGASRFLVAMGEGVRALHMEGYCFPDRQVLVVGDQVHESRPEDGSCMSFLADEDAQEASPFAFDDRMEGLDVTAHGDGTVTARFSDEDGNYTLHVDAKGRATRLAVEAPDGDGAFDVFYGARGTLTAPEPTGRLPSGVSGYCMLSAGSCTYTAFEGDDAPLSDFQVRVYADGRTPDDDPEAQPVAAFALDGGDQSSGGFSFSPTEDGDGSFGDGDSFLLTAPGDDYEVVVWDLWADSDVMESPVPGLGPLWAALAFVGAALLARRDIATH